jgi:hypothetical protein
MDMEWSVPVEKWAWKKWKVVEKINDMERSFRNIIDGMIDSWRWRWFGDARNRGLRRNRMYEVSCVIV